MVKSSLKNSNSESLRQHGLAGVRLWLAPHGSNFRTFILSSRARNLRRSLIHPLISSTATDGDVNSERHSRPNIQVQNIYSHSLSHSASVSRSCFDLHLPSVSPCLRGLSRSFWLPYNKAARRVWHVKLPACQRLWQRHHWLQMQLEALFFFFFFFLLMLNSHCGHCSDGSTATSQQPTVTASSAL